MADLIAILIVIALFGLMFLAARGLERM